MAENGNVDNEGETVTTAVVVSVVVSVVSVVPELHAANVIAAAAIARIFFMFCL